MNSCPGPVAAQVPGWLDYLSAFSGVVGTVLALAAFAYSLAQARKAERAALRQRQLQFELSLLAEASRQFALTRTFAHIAGHLRALRASSQAPDELRILRAATGVEPSPGGLADLAELRDNATRSAPDDYQARQAAEVAVFDAVTREIDGAIQTRLK